MLVGRFSTSPRISTLLSTLAGLPVRLQHSPGSNQLLTDQSSRNPPDPCTGKCEICLFNKTEADRIDKVYTLNTDDDNKDILDDMSATPYLQLRTWLNEQRNDAVHCKLMSLINTGQEPEKRKTGGVFTVVKHLHQMYLKDNLQVHKSGVIMVRQKQGYYNGFTISVPEQILFGLAFMFHAKLQHPKKNTVNKILISVLLRPGHANHSGHHHNLMSPLFNNSVLTKTSTRTVHNHSPKARYILCSRRAGAPKSVCLSLQR